MRLYKSRHLVDVDDLLASRLIEGQLSFILPLNEHNIRLVRVGGASDHALYEVIRFSKPPLALLIVLTVRQIVDKWMQLFQKNKTDSENLLMRNLFQTLSLLAKKRKLLTASNLHLIDIQVNIGLLAY